MSDSRRRWSGPRRWRRRGRRWNGSCSGSPAGDRDVVLTTELYALAARDDRYKAITGAWMARSRAALERHFDPQTALILDALIEGLTLHRVLDDGSGAAADVARAIALLSGSSGPGCAALWVQRLGLGCGAGSRWGWAGVARF